jgi:hypothetical protein
MNLVEFAQASLVALTNRLLSGGDPSEIAWFEELSGFAVTRPKSDRVLLRFYCADGKAPLYPDWVKDAKARGATRLRLLTLGDFGQRMQKPEGGPPIADRQLAAFANTHETVLGLEFPGRVVGVRLGMSYPPPTDLTHEDVLRFIDDSPEKAHFREAMLWQDEHNLHFTDGKDWDAFIAAVGPGEETDFVEAFSTCVSNVAVSQPTGEKWWKLREEHRTKLAPELRALEFAAVTKLTATPVDRAAARGALEKALDDALAYARLKKLEPWDAAFAAALTALKEGPKPPLGGLDAVFDRLYPVESARLLTAVSRADVFGGMGSWNDLGLDDDAEYVRVSEALFSALRPALLAACA